MKKLNITRRRRPAGRVGALGLVIALGASGAFGGSKLEPFTPALPDDSLYPPGRYVYQRNCLTCHGARGDGKGDMAVGMIPKPRPFASGIFKYRSTPTGFLPTDADLARTVRNGISGTSMPAFANLSAREIRVVTEYLKSFSPRWRHAANYAAPIQLPPLPSWITNGVATAAHAARGRELFLGACASCHGERGDGNGPAAAALKDEWDQPAPPTDLRSPAVRSGPALTDLDRAIVTGIAGTPMPSFADAFDEEQRWDIIAYIARLRSNSTAGRFPAETLP